MTRGTITLNVRKRIVTTSRTYQDKWRNFGLMKLVNQPNSFKVFFKNASFKFMIGRDELSFVKLISQVYGAGDYSILLYGKGKSKGFKRFWDGLITEDKKFIRRKEMISFKEKASFFESESMAKDTESFIGRYMKTKRPGIWHYIN